MVQRKLLLAPIGPVPPVEGFQHHTYSLMLRPIGSLAFLIHILSHQQMQSASKVVRTLEQYRLLQTPHPIPLGLPQTLHLRRSPPSLRALSPALISQSRARDTGRTYGTFMVNVAPPHFTCVSCTYLNGARVLDSKAGLSVKELVGACTGDAESVSDFELPCIPLWVGSV